MAQGIPINRSADTVTCRKVFFAFLKVHLPRHLFTNLNAGLEMQKNCTHSAGNLLSEYGKSGTSADPHSKFSFSCISTAEMPALRIWIHVWMELIMLDYEPRGDTFRWHPGLLHGHLLFRGWHLQARDEAGQNWLSAHGKVFGHALGYASWRLHFWKSWFYMGVCFFCHWSRHWIIADGVQDEKVSVDYQEIGNSFHWFQIPIPLLVTSDSLTCHTWFPRLSHDSLTCHMILSRLNSSHVIPDCQPCRF